MKTIGGKQFPTIWSDLAISIESMDALDTEPSVSVVCITDWLNKYHNLPTDTSDGNLVDDLYKEGIELIAYLPSVTARVRILHGQCKGASETWASAQKASYSGEKLSEAARDRMILVEPKYTEFRNSLIMLDTYERWCTDMWFALKEALNELNMRMKRIINDQPPMPRSV
jgi:hypothetical protein